MQMSLWDFIQQIILVTQGHLIFKRMNTFKWRRQASRMFSHERLLKPVSKGHSSCTQSQTQGSNCYLIECVPFNHIKIFTWDIIGSEQNIQYCRWDKSESRDQKRIELESRPMPKMGWDWIKTESTCFRYVFLWSWPLSPVPWSYFHGLGLFINSGACGFSLDSFLVSVLT